MYQMLAELANEFQKIGLEADFLLGKEWLQHLKGKLTNCIITANLTRKSLANALMNDSKLILTLYPPSFILSGDRKMHKEKLEMLRIILENKITIFSFGEDWLNTKQGPFDYVFTLLNFPYTAEFNFEYKKGSTPILLFGRKGESKRKMKFKDLLGLVSQNIEEPIIYHGVYENTVQKIGLFLEVLDDEAIFRLSSQQEIDALIVGELSYHSKQAVILSKLPVVVVGRSLLENIFLGKVRRLLMEQLTIDMPEIICVKEEPFGSIFKKE